MPGTDADELDAAAFTAAFARHGRSLWVIAAAWVGRADAEDLVQEAARVAWERRRHFAHGSDLRAWLAQIVRHLGANGRRRRRPQPCEPATFAERAAPAERSPEWPFDPDRSGLSDELAAALRQLGETARACLLLHAVLDHTFAEIATMLDVPENTAQSHVRRARLVLQQTLTANANVPAAKEVLP